MRGSPTPMARGAARLAAGRATRARLLPPSLPVCFLACGLRSPSQFGLFESQSSSFNNFRTDLVFIDGCLDSERYISDILEPHVVPFMNSYEDVWIFQHDNARPHSARNTNNFLSENSIHTLPWPAMVIFSLCAFHLKL